MAGLLCGRRERAVLGVRPLLDLPFRFGSRLRFSVLLLFSLLSFVVLSSSVAAQYFVVEADPFESHPNIMDLYVSKPNVFTEDLFHGGIPQYDMYIAFFDRSGRMVDSYQLMTGTNDVPFDPDVNTFKVFGKDFPEKGESANLLLEHSVEFCNDNGTCDSCQGPDCSLIENFLSCPSDCPSGSYDFYCDLQKDGICDPDCDGIDADCPDCEPFCAVDGASCEDLGGTLCSADEDCVGGYFSSGILDENDEPVTDCCIGGNCSVTDPLVAFWQDKDVESAFPTEAEIREDNVSVDRIAGIAPSGKRAVGLGEKLGLPEEVSNIGILEIVGVGVLFSVLVVLLLFFFHKRTPLHSSDPATPEGLQQEVSLLVSKGYGYSVIKSFLLRKGFDPKLVDEAIKRDYDARR